MRKKHRILSVVALYVVFILFYSLFFIFHLENTILFFILTVSSVAVLLTSTVYTAIIQSNGRQDKWFIKKKIPTKTMSIAKKYDDFFEDYIDALPSIEEYVESDESYEVMEIVNKYIFTAFSQEELHKINLLDLPKMDKILFIREMLYYSEEERENLIENMVKNQSNTDEEIIYTPPLNIIELDKQIRVYIKSLIEPGEKTKIIIVDTSDLIISLKERIGILYDYETGSFLISSGGIILKSEKKILEYALDNDDEIVLIPSRKERNEKKRVRN